MTVVQYDIDNWLVSLSRSLESYVGQFFNLELVDIEMSFPDTQNMTKSSPLPKPLIHFEIDDIEDPVDGFGTPGREVYDDNEGTFELQEAQRHLVNFDVGVWVSAECGGGTERLRIMQVLKNIFSVAGAKVAMREATGGLYPLRFSGGRTPLDRINDLPVWRATEMTLIVQCYSRHRPETLTLVPSGGFELHDNMVIDGDEPVTTP